MIHKFFPLITCWLIFVILLCQDCISQLTLTYLDSSALPKKIQYTGHIAEAVRWTDCAGDHIVLTTETGETASASGTEAGNRDAALFGYHYFLKGDSVNLTWKLHDFIKDCPVDPCANFIKNTFAVTDLDVDGHAEIWLMYKTACRGDVSPANMKIIMYEEGRKYAARGTNKVQLSEKEYVGGDYSFDEAFKKAPSSFRDYATQLWKKNILEKWDQ